MRCLVLGAGFAGSHVAEAARRRGREVIASVRSSTRADALDIRGFQVTREPILDVASRFVTADTQVVVCFPPDGTTDASLAPLLRMARAISYISSTGVYGDTEGVIDGDTPLPANVSESQARILDAETAYRAVGATVLRAPGIYGKERGLHRRVVSGVHRMPGDGSGYTSRIHAEDLASLLLATASENVRGATFVVGDLEPARQCDVVKWICEEYGCSYPPSVPPAQVHETLRRNRRVDASRALRELDVHLRYPTFREGMKKS